MRELWGEKREVEAQAFVYVIQSKSRSSVKGWVDEPTSVDGQVCITLVIFGHYIYEIVYGWMHIYLAAHYF